MRKRLSLPATLTMTVTVLSACSSSQSPAADGSADARDGFDDRLGDAPGDSLADASEVCYRNPFTKEYGLACRVRPGAPTGTVCPEAVCVASDCPSATCQSCESALFCIPESGGSGCGGSTCDINGCPMGCRAVG